MAMTVGARLRTLRETSGERLVDISARTGLSVSHLSDIEHDRGLPSLPALHSVALAFDMTIAQFLSGVEPYGD